MPQPYKRLLEVIARAEGVFCTAALATMVLANLVEIVARNLFQRSFAGVQELTLLLGCWMIFLGAAKILKSGALLNVDIIIRRLKGRARPAADLLINLVIAGILTTIIKYGLELRILQATRTTEALHIPSSWFGMSLIVASFSMSLAVLDRLVSAARALTTTGDPRGAVGR